MVSPIRPIRLLSWNVNGVRAVHKKGFLDWLGREKPDILCLQETKAEPPQLAPELREPADYRAEWAWGEKKGYSGVATLSREAPEDVQRGLGVERFDREGRVLRTVHRDLVLYNIYFPNGKSRPERLAYKMDFYESLLKILLERRGQGEKNVVICGDVNTAHKEIDLARPRENRTISGFLPEERAWMDRFLAAGFIDTFREFEPGPGHYSWWDMQSRARERNVGWRIDYFFVSEPLRPRLKGAFLQPAVMGSDHCPAGITLA